MLNLGIKLTELGLVPEAVLRVAIKKIIQQRLSEIPINAKERETEKTRFIEELRSSPIALSTNQANEQHYEIPTAYFQTVLGKHLKYSSGLWPIGSESLDESEAAMLERTCQRAKLIDGQRILEIGCGWGSLSLWMATNYPSSQIVAVSNSNSQREYIKSQAVKRQLTNIEVVTCDINDFEPAGFFDRVVWLKCLSMFVITAHY